MCTQHAIYCFAKTVVTREIVLFWNNFEIIFSVLFHI